MKKMTKILSVVMTVVMLFCATPIAGLDTLWSIDTKANSTSDYKSGVLWYEIDYEYEEIAIVGCDENASGEIVIPSTINGYPVTSIDSEAFGWCEDITSVVIPAGVTEIGSLPFFDCTNLTSITVDKANPNYSSDKNGVLFNKDKTVLMQYPCGKSGSYVIPDSVRYIDIGAFARSVKLVSVTIPDTVTDIGYGAFLDCWSLFSVTIGNNVKAIGDMTFSQCALSAVTIPDSVEYIGEDAFGGCIHLESVTMGKNVKTIKDNAFYWCDYLNDIYYSETSENPHEIEIGSGNECFLNATVHFRDQTPDYTDFEIELIDNEIVITDYVGSATGVVIPSEVAGYPFTAIGDYAFEDCDNITSIVIPDSVKSIGEGAFNDCYDLSWINFGNGVTSIGAGAFHYCGDLYTVTIPDSVQYIGVGAFGECHHLSVVNTGNGVTKIDTGAFVECDELVSVTISNCIETIGDGAFYNCVNLTDVYYDGTEDDWNKISIGSYNECLLNATIHFKEDEEEITIFTYEIENGEVTITGCDESASGEIIIPETINGYPVTVIGDKAFFNCAEITSVIIPDSVISIGDSAFGWCLDLDTINIPDGVTYIGKWAFYNTAITTVTIPDSVKEIAYGAFLEGMLTSVTLGNGIENIGEYAFGECRKISDVYYNGTEAEWSEISIDEGNEYLINATIHFSDEEETAESILTYEIENGEVAITGCNESANGAIVIPSAIEGYPVTSISVHWTFSDNPKITSISIPETIRDLSSTSFGNLTGLTSIKVNPNNPYYSSNNGILYNKDQTELIKYPAGKSDTEFIVPDSVTSINYVAFYTCENLTSLEIHERVTHIDVHPVSECKNLKKITVSEYNPNYSTDDSGVLYDKNKTVLIQYPSGSPIQHYTIPEGVTHILYSAFDNSQNLVSITMPDTVTSIEERVFYYCTSLTSVSLSEKLDKIPETSFFYCKSLTSIHLPDSVTVIEDYAFYSCTDLTSVKIGNNVTNIGEEAFNWCTSLTDVYFDGTKAEWNKISIASSNEYLTTANIHYGAEPTPTLSEINFEQSNYTVNYKGSIKVTATPNAETNKKINYVIGDSTVATIDDEGNITTVGPGTATVVATIEDTDISDTCTITVSYTWWQWIIMILLFGWIWY